MQSFEEAFKTLMHEINQYKTSCEDNGQVRSNFWAYTQTKTSELLSFFPIPYLNIEQVRVSGKTGRDKAIKFQGYMTQIKNNFLNDTHELIKYLFTQYPNPKQSKSNFKDAIWIAIRTMAGFTEVHINYLSEQYLNVYKPNRNNGFGENSISSDDITEAKNSAIYIINEAITGKYHKTTVECLNNMELSKEHSDTILKTPRAYCEIFDCGELLLNTLNSILNPNFDPNQINNK